MERKGFIGGSDLYDIMHGNWHKLWLIKTGRQEPEDLSHLFNVRLGQHTEDFNMQWLGYSKFVVIPSQTVKRSTKITEVSMNISGVPYKGQLDGVAVEENSQRTWDECIEQSTHVVECKHTSSYKTMSDMLDAYLPQMHLYMRLSDKKFCLFSVIFGNRHEYVEVTYNEEYWKEVHKLVYNFWQHVKDDTEPPTEDAVSLDWKTVEIDNLIARDANKENFFVRTAQRYIETIDVAKENEQYKKELTSSMNDNEREVFCDLLTIKRDKRGAKRISVKKGVA